MKVYPYPGQVMMKIDSMVSDVYLPAEKEQREVVSNAEEATVVTSMVGQKLGQGVHKPVLDIDLPVKLTESSTPGHYHLFIDKELTWGQYTKLLDALETCGIIEPGYRSASLQRGYTAVRVPWVRKGASNDPCRGYSGAGTEALNPHRLFPTKIG